MKFLSIIFFISTISALWAEPIRLSPSFFRSEDFKKSFVGSYGFLAPVEPKVSRAESELLVEVREHFDAGQFSQAESKLKRYISASDNVRGPEGELQTVSPAMVFVLGTLYNQSGRLDDARRAYLEAIRRYPDFRRAHTNLAFLYVKQEQLDKALPHLQQAIELGENSHRVFGLVGFAYLSAENPVAAETAYRQAVMLQPGENEWKKGLAQTLVVQGKYEESAAMLRTLIAETPAEKNYYLQLTNALYEMDRKMEAAGVLEELRLRGLADESDLNQLGTIYINLEQPQLALLAYLAAIDSQQVFNPSTALESATILVEYGYPEKAGALIRKIRSAGAGRMDLEDRVQMGLVDLKIARTADDLERAEQLLDELVKLDAANGEVLLQTGEFHVALADKADGDDERLAQIGLAQSQFRLAARQPEVAYQANISLSRLFVRERDYIEALSFLEKGYQLRPSGSLDSYLKQIKRVAARQKQREEREAAERSAKSK